MKWTKITDRYPDYSGDYLVAYPSSSKNIAIAYFDDLNNTFYHKTGTKEFRTITYWMSLPTPPNK